MSSRVPQLHNNFPFAFIALLSCANSCKNLLEAVPFLVEIKKKKKILFCLRVSVWVYYIFVIAGLEPLPQHTLLSLSLLSLSLSSSLGFYSVVYAISIRTTGGAVCVCVVASAVNTDVWGSCAAQRRNDEQEGRGKNNNNNLLGFGSSSPGAKREKNERKNKKTNPKRDWLSHCCTRHTHALICVHIHVTFPIWNNGWHHLPLLLANGPLQPAKRSGIKLSHSPPPSAGDKLSKTLQQPSPKYRMHVPNH